MNEMIEYRRVPLDRGIEKSNHRHQYLWYRKHGTQELLKGINLIGTFLFCIFAAVLFFVCGVESVHR